MGGGCLEEGEEREPCSPCEKSKGFLGGFYHGAFLGPELTQGAPLSVCLLHFSATPTLSHPLGLLALITLSLPLWLSLSLFVALSFLEARLWSEWRGIVPLGVRKQGNDSLSFSPHLQPSPSGSSFNSAGLLSSQVISSP